MKSRQEYLDEYGEPETLEEILDYCACITNLEGMEHKIVDKFNWFICSLITGGSQYIKCGFLDKKPDPIKIMAAEEVSKIWERYGDAFSSKPGNLLEYGRAFKQYCEEEYLHIPTYVITNRNNWKAFSSGYVNRPTNGNLADLCVDAGLNAALHQRGILGVSKLHGVWCIMDCLGRWEYLPNHYYVEQV